VLVPVDGAGDGVLSLGDGAGEEVAGFGLLDGDGLAVGDGLLVGEGLLVTDGLLVGVADGDVVGALADDAGTVDVATGVGCVALGAELGNSVMTGSAAALCLATAGDGEGAGADVGEATARICGPRRPRGLTAAPFGAAPEKPAELVGTTR
jgi:hypothetical protein